MTNEELNQNEFDRQYGESYRQGEGHCAPTNPENRFDEAPASVESSTNNTNETAKELAQQMVTTSIRCCPTVLLSTVAISSH